MKKAGYLLAVTGMAVSLLAGAAMPVTAMAASDAAWKPAALAEENCRTGEWKLADSPELPEKVRVLCDRAFEGLMGAAYTPVALISTRTTGLHTQYRVLCKMSLAIPDAQEQYVVVTVGQSWLGRAELLEIGDELGKSDLSEEPMAGGWQEAGSPVLTEDALRAFEKATEDLLGVEYRPVALLSTQMVAGTNYRILCEETVVYPGAETKETILTIYEDLEGNARILNETVQ